MSPLPRHIGPFPNLLVAGPLSDRRQRAAVVGAASRSRMADLQRSWARAWRGIGARDDRASVRDALLAAHGEPHRSYHTLQHLHECIDRFETCSNLAARPAEVETAKRRGILAGFLARDPLYATPRLRVELEERARANLSLAIGG